jgi:hypothetical protein
MDEPTRDVGHPDICPDLAPESVVLVGIFAYPAGIVVQRLCLVEATGSNLSARVTVVAVE